MFVFTLLGAIFLVVGLGLIALAMAPELLGMRVDPDEALGLWITAGTFVPLGLVFLGVGVVAGRARSRERRLVREGLAGTATIRDIENTGWMVNNEPRMRLTLEVRAPGVASYDVVHDVTVPWWAHARLHPGAIIPVRVDPHHRTSLVLRWSEGWETDSAEPPIQDAPAPTPPELPDAAEGVTSGGRPGRATIRQLRDTGVAVRGDRLYALELEVRVGTDDPYTVKQNAVVPASDAARLFRGASLPVRVDPDDPSALLIDWGAA